ncbi:MAG: tetratricopeptide repeat protein [Candidatus Omnitrophota bacterium]
MKNITISLILIIILGFIIYANSINGQFIWDDKYLVRDNVYIKNFTHIPDIFTQGIGSGSGAGRQYSFYRPLQLATYLIDYSIWRLDVRGYHLTNILLHILVASAIFWLIHLLYNNWFISFFTSILFLTHPLHTEVVTYISGRADSLAVLFMLLAFIFYIKSENNKGYLVIVCLSYILALLAKEISLIFPVILLLYHYIFRKKINLFALAGILIIPVTYILLRFTLLKSIISVIIFPSTSFIDRLPGFFVAIFNYLKLIFLPFNLHMQYGKALFSFSDPKALLGCGVSILLIVLAYRKRKNDPLLSFSIFWFFITLLPIANLYPVNAYMAEHWMYLPSIGIFVILVYGLIHFYRERRFKMLTIVAVTSLSVFYSFLTVRQNIYWRESIPFYQRTLKYAPDSWRLHNNLGLAYQEANKSEDAIRSFRRAIEIKPDYAEGYHNLGYISMSLGRKEEAVDLFKKALDIEPDLPDAYSNLGAIYYTNNQKAEAISAYQKALEINPNFAKAYNNLGVIYLSLNRKEEAKRLIEKAIAIDPDYSDAYNNLGNIYSSIQRFREAVSFYKQALKINPQNASAYYNLGLAYEALNQKAEAISAYQKALEINPHYAAVKNNLGILLDIQ